MEQFNLNTIPGKVAPVCNASQYDTGRTIRVNLFEGDQVYTLDGTEVVSVSVRKPDGHVVTESVTNTSAAYVEIITTEQMTACAGDNLCELKIEKGADVLGTLNFILRVELDPLAGGDPSESFVYNLSVQIAQAVADQYDSANVVFDAAPTAGHGVGFAVTSEGVKNALDALSLEDLADVTYTGTPASGEAVVWNGAEWTNGTVSTVGSLDDLNDVDTTGKVKDSSVVWDGTSEFVAKKLTVEMEQADYNALGGDYSNYKGCHIVITDGQNVTCNLGDLNDVDTTGANTGDILVKGVSGWEPKPLIKTKTITGTSTATGALACDVPCDHILNCIWNGTGIQRYAFPRSDIDTYLQVLYNDGNTLVPFASQSCSFLVIYY